MPAALGNYRHWRFIAPTGSVIPQLNRFRLHNIGIFITANETMQRQIIESVVDQNTRER